MIFISPRLLLELLSDGLKTYHIILFCYVLMDNHFHLFLETPLANLSEFMRWFNITYTSHYNRRHKRSGHLYQGRYKSILVEKDSYLHVLSRYIHLNPVRTKQKKNASLTEKKNYLKSYPWSSLLGYREDAKKDSFVDYAQILETYGGENRKGRKLYWDAICNNVSAGIDIKEKVIGGSILGSDKFIGWVRDRFLPSKYREIPAVKQLKRYNTKEEVIEVLCREVTENIFICVLSVLCGYLISLKGSWLILLKIGRSKTRFMSLKIERKLGGFLPRNF